MRHLRDFTRRRDARAFSDLLETHGIENQVRAGSSGHAVWVLDDERLEAARALASSDQDDPETRRRAKEIRRERRRTSRPVFGMFGRDADSTQTPLSIGVAALGLMCLLTALARLRGLDPMIPLAFTPFDASGWPLPFAWDQPWRLWTPMFVHFGLLHLLFNLAWLHRLGGEIEEHHGILIFLGLVAVGGASSNAAQYLMSGPRFGGMSGVNYVLFGFVWMQTRYSPRGGYQLSSSTVWLMMIWLVLCGTGIIGPIANAAHAVGLVVGLLAGLPVYLHFRASFEVKTAFSEGSWEDVHIRGWRRFERLWVRPYLPIWLLGIAGLVFLTEWL